MSELSVTELLKAVFVMVPAGIRQNVFLGVIDELVLQEKSKDCEIVELLKLLEAEAPIPGIAIDDVGVDKLINLFWSIPAEFVFMRERTSVGGDSDDCSQGNYERKSRPIFMKTKNELVRLIMECWNSEQTPITQMVFAFARDVVKADVRNRCVPEARQFLPDQQEAVIEGLRFRLNDKKFTPEVIESWWTSDLPQDIQKLFSMAWARNGGPGFVKSVIEKISSKR